LGQYDAALSSAVIANQIDLTLVPVYLTLGRAYIFNDQSDQAISVLQTYTKYAPEDYYAYQLLGMVYNDTEQYEVAKEILTTAITAGWKNADTYYQRGSSYLNLDEAQLAEADFKLAIIYEDQSFDAYIGLAKALDQLGQFGAAYVQVELNAYPLAKNDGMKAQVYYWEAQYLEEQGDPKSLIGATTAWYQLIALPPEVMPAEWRNQAYLHLKITPTYTPTLRYTLTPRSTDTRVPTSTSTP
jgi:tetratricopeptide (TPR) repeat protein